MPCLVLIMPVCEQFPVHFPLPSLSLCYFCLAHLALPGSPAAVPFHLPGRSKKAVNMLEECRSVDRYEKLNRISEGTYGVVYRWVVSLQTSSWWSTCLL